MAATALVSLLPLLVQTCFRSPSTASVPAGVYVLTYQPLRREAWVVVCLPPVVSALGRRRGYLGAGPCAGGASEVLKRVAALPGDVVQVSASGLVVDGKRLQHSRRRRRDTRGRVLPAVPEGTFEVASGTLWIYSDHTDRSWDSRYYGAVPLAGVRSSAALLLPTPRYLARLDGE
jgi:conjugative transfer signal peptidase TraF